ncbi:MAG: tRNA pseudouridine(38-40) synthase TruA [Parasporobacterium sp.]|nr:tRNA pseudouridine(38-40) synthase TruA [Parasporobacterium sp.]
MKKIKLTISYDGTNYVGWQVQKNGLAVEQVINEHLTKLLKEPITVTGCSRTDSGVHALGNVAAFETETRIPAEKISYALNQSLPDDIKIVKSEEVPADFHPRYSAKTKTYEYRILNCRYCLPTERLYSEYVYYPLNVDNMIEGAKYLVGEHDFVAFSSAGGQQKTSVRNVYLLEVSAQYLNQSTGKFDSDVDKSVNAVLLTETDNKSVFNEAASGEYNSKKDAVTCEPSAAAAVDKSSRDFTPKIITIRISGNGFLYNMVRIIAGTLIKTGLGMYPPEHVKEILDSCDRRLSAPKAAARGLTLVSIDYDNQNPQPAET